jgi:cellulose synthase/poly-beta-1,6-N-acetylglucosamine synthase-like glycosyltransferase
MNMLVASLLLALAGLVAIPTLVFCVEIVAAIAFQRRQIAEPICSNIRLRTAVLVPAHNEGAGLLPTLADIKSQLFPADRLLVVADNCTDHTAAIAKTDGAEVIERHDGTKVGKGYALDYGFRYLSLDPPEVVIVIDADCRVEYGAIDWLARTSAATGRPAQALYILASPIGSTDHQVAEFGARVKQSLRPLGLSALGLPCMLMGTGMALPWKVIRSVDLTCGSIVEDLKLGLDLSAAGHPPIFCPSACVKSEFPVSIDGSKAQRKRWEQGHIDVILDHALDLLILAITRRNWRLLALTLDLMVPPLSLLAMLVFSVFAVTGLAAVIGFSAIPLIVSTATFSGFAIAACLAWLKCGRDVLPIGAVLSIFPYVLGKVGLYHQVISGKADAKWDRADRKKSS